MPKTNEEYISVTCGCMGFVDSYRFLSCSLDSLVKTLIDNSHKTLKVFEKKNVDNVEIINIGKKFKKITEEDEMKNDSSKNLKNIFSRLKNKTRSSLIELYGKK